MNLLPTRYVFCESPIAEPRRTFGDIIPSEESVSLWLWAWPRLLGWPRRINWLFSPVVGNKKYPGDVWGIDSAGRLIIVETKINSGARLQNPFEDFVPYTKSNANSHLWSTETLFNRWWGLLISEQAFIASELPRLCLSRRPLGTHRGVVPYSVHRDAVWRWQEVYRDQIAPLIAVGPYERAVRRALRMRAAAGDPPPLFVGLVASVRPGDLLLSARGMKAFGVLKQQVGHNRVLLRGAHATKSSKGVRIRCWSPLVGMVA